MCQCRIGLGWRGCRWGLVCLTRHAPHQRFTRTTRTHATHLDTPFLCRLAVCRVSCLLSVVCLLSLVCPVCFLSAFLLSSVCPVLFVSFVRLAVCLCLSVRLSVSVRLSGRLSVSVCVCLVCVCGDLCVRKANQGESRVEARFVLTSKPFAVLSCVCLSCLSVSVSVCLSVCVCVCQHLIFHFFISFSFWVCFISKFILLFRIKIQLVFLVFRISMSGVPSLKNPRVWWKGAISDAQ